MKNPMRIEDNKLAGLGAQGLGRTQGAEAAERSGSEVGKKSGSNGTDEVNLSVLAERLQSLEAGSAEREKRIAELSSAYQSGRYEPNAEAVSGAMLNDAIAETTEAGASEMGTSE